MADTTNFMSQADFGKLVRQWSVKIKERSLGNLVFHTKVETKARKTPKLQATIKTSIRRYYGDISHIGFGFEPQGIYLHYGVGRGYVRNGGKVKITRKPKRYRKDGKPYKGSEKYREPHDWLDVEIRTGIKELANYVQNYHGDRAMQQVLKMVERVTIEKK